jgi:branched-chain amino acid transport system permease protein
MAATVLGPNRLKKGKRKSDCRACRDRSVWVASGKIGGNAVSTAFGEDSGNPGAARGDALSRWIGDHPIWSLVIVVAVILFLWLVLAPWPAGFEEVFGKKRLFVNALFNGITLGGLYFLVATGFTLIFGLMRYVNLAHGSLYLFGGYMGYEAGQWSGSYLLSYIVAFASCAIVGVAMQYFIFRRMEGEDLRQTLVTLGLSIIFSDLMVWVWGGNAIQIDTPDYLSGPIPTPIVVMVRSSGQAVFLQYPLGRLVIFLAAAVIGVGMWLALNRTRIGVMIRAGVDDRDMLSVLGYRVQLLFVAVFAFGAGLAGMAGVVGGTFQSISLGEDSNFLLASLVVVIVGGMGSIPGAAIGALIIGLSEQIGVVYFQNYSTVLSFLIMVIVLAIRPQGLLGRR